MFARWTKKKLIAFSLFCVHGNGKSFFFSSEKKSLNLDLWNAEAVCTHDKMQKKGKILEISNFFLICCRLAIVVEFFFPSELEKLASCTVGRSLEQTIQPTTSTRPARLSSSSSCCFRRFSTALLWRFSTGPSSRFAVSSSSAFSWRLHGAFLRPALPSLSSSLLLALFRALSRGQSLSSSSYGDYFFLRIFAHFCAFLCRSFDAADWYPESRTCTVRSLARPFWAYLFFWGGGGEIFWGGFVVGTSSDLRVEVSTSIWQGRKKSV